MDRVQIELLKPEHCARLGRLLEENDRQEITRYFHPFPMTAETAERLCMAGSKDRYYVSLLEGVMIGLSMLRGWDEGYDVPSFGVLVDYRHQGQGLGRRLTEHAISEAKRFGCSKLRLTVHESNVRAIRVYQSLGFQKESRDSVDGPVHPDKRIVMTMSLPG